MALKVGINGFGRIGRTVLRSIIENRRSEIEVVAINGTMPVETLAHLLKYDSVHGRFERFGGEVTIKGETMDAGQGAIQITKERDPNKINWKKLGADFVFECTGAFNNREGGEAHLANGAKGVLISAPAKDVDKTIVYGVNHKQMTADDKIISNASCTTNCLAPVAMVLHQNIGIEQGFMTTIHSYTTDQRLLDNSHRDLYRARGAATSLIPTTTGAAKSVEQVLPELKGKLDGAAMRVPTPNVSVIDLKFVPSRKTSIEEINNLMRKAAEGSMKNIIDYTEEKLVSCDFVHDPHSAIFHADETKVMQDGLCRVIAWYDNEWGFSCRMGDTALHMAKLI